MYGERHICSHPFIILVHYLRLETKNSSDSTKDLTGKQKHMVGVRLILGCAMHLYLHPNFKKYFDERAA